MVDCQCSSVLFRAHGHHCRPQHRAVDIWISRAVLHCVATASQAQQDTVLGVGDAHGAHARCSFHARCWSDFQHGGAFVRTIATAIVMFQPAHECYGIIAPMIVCCSLRKFLRSGAKPVHRSAAGRWPLPTARLPTAHSSSESMASQGLVRELCGRPILGTTHYYQPKILTFTITFDIKLLTLHRSRMS